MHSGAGDTTQLVPGSPIRTPWDHSSVDSSPRPIAASHVLHRLLVPRHPPCALTNLTTKMLASTVQFSTNNTHTPTHPTPTRGTDKPPRRKHPRQHTHPHTREAPRPTPGARPHPGHGTGLFPQDPTGCPTTPTPPPGAETADRPPAGSPPPPTPPHHPTPTGQQPADHHQAATHHNHHQSTLVDRNGWTGRCRGFLRGAP
jgi:hypothetical protein